MPRRTRLIFSANNCTTTVPVEWQEEQVTEIVPCALCGDQLYATFWRAYVEMSGKLTPAHWVVCTACLDASNASIAAEETPT